MEAGAKRCFGKMVMTDSCYGWTGGYRYECTTCGSYIVTHVDKGDTMVCGAERKKEEEDAPGA
jgi:hypothetical protein